MAALGAYYILFIEFNVKKFPNGHPMTESFNFAVEMTKKYGQTLEEDEYQEFISMKQKQLIDEANKYISEQYVFAAAGIHNCDEFYKIYNDDSLRENETFYSAEAAFYSSECDYTGFKIEALEDIKTRFDGLDSEIYGDIPSNLSEYGKSIMPYEVQDILSMWNINILTSVLICMIIIISPMSVVDNFREIRSLQYSSKNGRNLLITQLLATISSAFIIITLIAAILISLFAAKGTQIFWNNKMASFLGDVPYPDITMGQYVIVSIILIYLFVLGTAMIAFSFSLCCNNYISLVIKLIPLTVGTIILGNYLFGIDVAKLFIYFHFKICVVTCLVIFITGIITSFITINYKAKKDLL